MNEFDKFTDSLHRWRAGHQLFSCIDQWLVFVLTRLQSALTGGDWEAAVRYFNLTAQLLEGSAAVLKYTGDMPPGVYEAETKEDMQLFAPNRMSGANMKDHRALVEVIRAIRGGEARETWPEPVRVAHASFVHALGAALDNHVHACEHAAGERAPISHPHGRPATQTLTSAVNPGRLAQAGAEVAPRGRCPFHTS